MKDGITMCSSFLFLEEGFVVSRSRSVIEEDGLIYFICEEELQISRFTITYRISYSYFTLFVCLEPSSEMFTLEELLICT